MSAVWLLSSRGRPDQAQQTVDACQRAGMTSRGVLYVDEDDGSYDRIRLPGNWTAHREPRWLSLQGSLQWCLDEFPDATQYGWLADDNRPITRGWDAALEAAAADWNLAYARDLWLSEDPFEEASLQQGRNLSAGLCWGGELVREVGWWALPGVKQAGIDTAWTEIVRPLRLHRYVRDVVVEHRHWRSGKRVRDAGDEWTRDGVEYVDRDIVTRNQWVWSKEYRTTLRRVAAVAENADVEGMLLELRQSLIDELWRDGKLPAARLQRIQEGQLDPLIFSEVHDPDADDGQAGLDRPVRPERPGADAAGVGDGGRRRRRKADPRPAPDGSKDPVRAPRRAKRTRG